MRPYLPRKLQYRAEQNIKKVTAHSANKSHELSPFCFCITKLSFWNTHKEHNCHNCISYHNTFFPIYMSIITNFTTIIKVNFMEFCKKIIEAKKPLLFYAYLHIFFRKFPCGFCHYFFFIAQEILHLMLLNHNTKLTTYLISLNIKLNPSYNIHYFIIINIF